MLSQSRKFLKRFFLRVQSMEDEAISRQKIDVEFICRYNAGADYGEIGLVT